MQFLVNFVAAKSWSVATLDVWNLLPARARPLQRFYNWRIAAASEIPSIVSPRLATIYGTI